MVCQRLLGVVLLFFVLMPAAGAQDSGPHAFTVDELNAGLPEPPGDVNRDTPQATLETFINAASDEAWGVAAHTLNLNDIPQGEQEEKGAELARKLDLVLKRGVILDWATLPDRPDALDANRASDAPLSGEPRRNLSLSLVSLPERPVSIRLSRVKPEDGDPVWVFPEQTVENIDALYAFYAPTAFEERLPPVLMTRAMWTLTWWEVIALPVLLAVCFGFAALTYWAIGRLHDRLRDVAVAGALLDTVKSPAALLVFAFSFGLFRRSAFTLSGAVNAAIAPVVTAAVVLAIAALFVRVLDAVIDKVTRSKNEDITQPQAEADREHYTSLSAIRRFALVLLLVVGTAIVLIQTNLDKTLGFSLLASAGAIGIVLAFAAREVLSNIMASLQIGLADSVRIGDAVNWEGQWAYVERIGFTHVRLRTWDNRRLMTPVNEFVSETFENWTKIDPQINKYVVLILDHRADFGRLREIFYDWIAKEDGLDPDNENTKVQAIGHSREGVEARFLFEASDASTGWTQQCALREHLLRELSKLDQASEDGPVFLPREREVKTQKRAA